MGPCGKWLHELMSDLLERFSSSCLSATVDLSSSSHISTLIRWEFLMTMGTSSNICSKPMLAFFKLKRDREREEKRGGETGGKGEITFLINTSHFSCGFWPSFYFKLTRSVMDPTMWLKINDAKKKWWGFKHLIWFLRNPHGLQCLAPCDNHCSFCWAESQSQVYTNYRNFFAIRNIKLF